MDQLEQNEWQRSLYRHLPQLRHPLRLPLVRIQYLYQQSFLNSNGNNMKMNIFVVIQRYIAFYNSFIVNWNKRSHCLSRLLRTEFQDLA